MTILRGLASSHVIAPARGFEQTGCAKRKTDEICRDAIAKGVMIG